jgi:hypothetical protein
MPMILKRPPAGQNRLRDDPADDSLRVDGQHFAENSRAPGQDPAGRRPLEQIIMGRAKSSGSGRYASVSHSGSGTPRCWFS